MDQNTKTGQQKSGIPLPLSKHLTKKLSDKRPLIMLAGPSGVNPVSTSKDLKKPSGRRRRSFTTETTLLTLQRRCIFVPPENDSNITVISISSDEDDDNKYNTDDVARGTVSGTPGLSARVEHISRSLNKLHDREMYQDTTPMEHRDTCVGVKRTLNFNETVREALNSCMSSMDHDYSSEIMLYLQEAETKSEAEPLVETARRAYVINWLMEINDVDGDPATIQTAVWYLDAVLASSPITPKADVQLLAAASYWIAAKVQGLRTPAYEIVSYANDAFTLENLLVAETSVLTRLKFPRLPIIPQDYISYLAWWCNKEGPHEVGLPSTFLCLCGMMVHKDLYSCEYPSILAAVSVKCALLLLKKEEFETRLRQCPVYKDAKKKAGPERMLRIAANLCQAVREVANKDYSYDFVFRQYGEPPDFIAQTITSAVRETMVDYQKKHLYV